MANTIGSIMGMGNTGMGRPGGAYRPMRFNPPQQQQDRLYEEMIAQTQDENQMEMNRRRKEYFERQEKINSHPLRIECDDPGMIFE